MAMPAVRTPIVDMVVPVEITPGGLDRLLKLFGERPNPLIKYRNGKALLVSPGEDHERAVQRLDVLLLAFCTALEIEFRGYRSTLVRKPGLDHGVMPDLTYYVQNFSSIRGIRGKIDLASYPPPDLAVEVVVTHGHELAMEVCKELGVPELWVHDVAEGGVTFWQRRRGGYSPRERSPAFPFLRSADLAPWLADTDAGDNAEFVRMQRWAETVLAPRRRPDKGH
jgi:Uma2 family endonuclease